MNVAKVAAEGNNGEAAQVGGSWLERAKEYYHDLKAEMHKVTWPTRQQVQATTAVVIACVFAFAAYFALVDMLLGRLIARVFEVLAK